MSARVDLPPPSPVGPASRPGLRVAIGALAAILALLALWHSIFIPIGAGRAGVLWSRFGGGTVLDRTYGEGMAVIWPWDEMVLYDVRLQQMHDDVPVLTSDGLQVSLGVTIRFAPRATELATLHRMVGPAYRRAVVWPDAIAAVRHVVRQFVADDLRVLGETELSAKVDAAARQSVRGHWVDLDRVLITRIVLPGKVEAQIEARLAEEQKALAGPSLLAQAETERQKRLIEAAGVREFEARSRVSMLQWRGIEALERLAASPNGKVVVLGGAPGRPSILVEPERGGVAVSDAVGQGEGVKEKAEAQHQH